MTDYLAPGVMGGSYFAGDQATTPATPKVALTIPLLENPTMLHAYSWTAPDGSPMHWANAENPVETEIASAVAFLKTPGNSGVIFWWRAWPVDGNPFTNTSLHDLLIGGPKFEVAQVWHTRFWGGLDAAGVLPRRTVIDDEQGWGYYSLGTNPQFEALAAALDDPVARRSLPPNLCWLEPRKWIDNGNNYGGQNPALPYWQGYDQAGEASVAWTLYATQVKNAMLRTLLRDIPLRLVGKYIPTGCFYTQRVSFQSGDYNGYSLIDSVVDFESQPSIYSPYGNVGMYYNNGRNPWWIQFLINLNILRSARNMGAVVPWVGSPSYGAGYDGGPLNMQPAVSWLWGETIKHIGQMGINELFLWNPTEHNYPASDHTQIAAALAHTPVVQATISDYWPRLDTYAVTCETVTTKGVTTKYSDFVALLPA